MKAAWSLALGIICVARIAGAEPTDADRALATELFNQGRSEMGAGQYASACPKLEESQRLDPGGGTLLNVARCHELAGRTATAWTEFTEALAIAEREGQRERVEFAAERIAALEPLLSRVIIVVPSTTDRPDLVVRRDGTPVARAAWGTPMPVDPGAHKIEASAAGYRDWSEEVVVDPNGARKEVHVPPLQALPPPPPLPPPFVPPPRILPIRPPARRADVATILGWTLIGTSVASAGITAAAGIATIILDQQSDPLCEPKCNQEGYDKNQSAKASADTSTAFAVIGAAALGAGLAVLLTRGDARPRSQKSALVVEF